MSKKLRKTTEEYKREVYDLVGDEYTILGEYKGYDVKILTRHNVCGREYEVSPHRFLTCGRRCTRCKDLTDRTKEFKRKIKELYDDRYEVVGEYVNTNSNIELECKKCGTLFSRYINQISAPMYAKNNPILCPNCKETKSIRKEGIYRHTKESFNEIMSQYSDEYEIIKYTNYESLSKFVHKTCGHIFEKKPYEMIASLKAGYNICPNCEGNSKRNKTTLEVMDDIYSASKGEYFLVSEYINGKKPITLYHTKCGKTFNTSYVNFKHNHGCPYCNGGISMNEEKFKDRLYDIYEGKYSLISEFIDIHENVTLLCNDCNTKFELSAQLVLSGKGRMCPVCNKNTLYSKGEKEIVEFIRKIYKGTILENIKGIIPDNLELDIYLPDLKIAIEFDGLYWHSHQVKKDKRYHLNKTNLCEKQGIRLIHIFEDEWEFKSNIVKDKLKTLLGCNKKRIYARQCLVKEISDASIKNKFLEERHIQGKDNSSIKLGLYTSTKYYDTEKLVAVMTFCKPRTALGQRKGSTNYDYELSRYASLKGYNIIGGFSKLLKYFERNYDWKKIITYADRRWSQGNVYLKNGFTLIHNSDVSYWYFTTSEGIRYHRFKFCMNQLKEKYPEIHSMYVGKPDAENKIMEELGYLKIYDCGNMVFEYVKN